MNYARINITPTPANPLGVIGNFEAKGQKIVGFQLADVMAQVEANKEAQAYLVACEGPGGAVDVGDQIYDYLNNLKAQGKRVDTITAGDVGSILTKIFMVGEERTIREGDKFYIHSPWIPETSGNASQLSKELQGLLEEENKLHNFYKQITGLNDAGLKGLMSGSQGNDGTFITADQAVALRFATKKAGSKIKAYALLKTEDMSKPKGKIEQAFAGLLSALGIVSMVPLEVEGGKKLSANTEDPANLPGADVTDEAGQPAPDGEHKLSDGRVLVVEGGKVKEVKPAQADPAQPAATAPATPAAAATPAVPATPAPSAADPNAGLLAAIAEIKAELAQIKGVNVDEKIAAAITEMKNSIPMGKKPVAAFNNNGNASGAQTVALSPVQMKMLEKQKEQTEKGL